MRRRSSRGFTLLEVMISLAILGLALTAIVDINGTTIRTHSYAKQMTVATLLARSKMADLESKFDYEGFTSEFDEKMEGDFADEGFEGFRWEAELIKPDLDPANATAMIEQVVGKMMGEVPGAEGASSAGAAPSDPTMAVDGGMMAMVKPMVQAQMTTLIETLKSTLREVRLHVYWDDGGHRESVDVVTHFVVLSPANAPAPANVPPPPLNGLGGGAFNPGNLQGETGDSGAPK